MLNDFNYCVHDLQRYLRELNDALKKEYMANGFGKDNLTMINLLLDLEVIANQRLADLEGD